MNPCQLQYVEYVKEKVFPGTEIEDTPNQSGEYVVAQVSIESLKYSFMLCCLFTKKKDVYLPENIIELGPEERKQIFYLVGKGGSCTSPKNQYLIPAHLGGVKMKERDLEKYVMS
ncbi:MAG: hypothetical protein AAFU57_13835 [Bacteroidota bacterium]